VVAARYGSFPIVLETYRECLRDVFDVPALVGVLRDLRSRRIRLTTVDTRLPSPFAASLLYGYVATYLYDGDAPLAERRAHALAVDQAQLRELIGEGALRDLLSADAIDTAEHDAQGLSATHQARSGDGLHDLLLRVGDLSVDELTLRARPGLIPDALEALVGARRILAVRIGGERRFIAVEDGARYRDALGTPLPQGLPESLLAPAPDAVLSLVRRFARTHGPFPATDLATRFGLGVAVIDAALLELRAAGRVVDGEFRPGGHGREWCDTGMLRIIRRQSLAALRDEVAPVDTAVFGRFLLQWHGIGRPRRGLDALLDVVEHLQGTPLVASTLESQVLPSRLEGYVPAQLDTLLSAGEVTWVGLDPLGEHDGRVALYLTDHLRRLLPPTLTTEPTGLPPRAAAALAYLLREGAAFFAAIHEASGGGFPQETVDALWALVWQGLVTNDALHPLRAYLSGPGASPRRDRRTAGFRSRRLVPPSAEGRWSAVPTTGRSADTAWATAMAQQWLTRHGVVTRDLVAIDPVPGGFSTVYPVLRRLEETGRIRRGYFVAGLGAAQFATPGAVDLLRAARATDEAPQVAVLAATDPANVYGALVDWPQWPRGATAPLRASRSAGARVVLVDGAAVAWLARGGRALLLALPPDEPEQSRAGQAVARALARLGHEGPPGRRGLLLAEINGAAAAAAPEAHCFLAAGFVAAAGGLQLRVPRDA
jgi:ATP-dependent Lhr-like helicase